MFGNNGKFLRWNSLGLVIVPLEAYPSISQGIIGNLLSDIKNHLKKKKHISKLEKQPFELVLKESGTRWINKLDNIKSTVVNVK